MNVKELIKEFEEIGIHGLNMFGTVVKGIPTKTAIDLIKQLDEPQPVKVPQCVADYIEESRLKGWDLLASMCFVVSAKNKKTTKWFYLGENKNIFALAWIFGYDVEEEKRYLVKFKGFNSSYIILKHRHYGNTWFLGGEQEYEFYRLHHTRKELEESDFGWVFDCPGIEIEEVEG